MTRRGGRPSRPARSAASGAPASVEARPTAANFSASARKIAETVLVLVRACVAGSSRALVLGGCALVVVLGACASSGSTAASTNTPRALPAADPRAVQKFLDASALMSSRVASDNQRAEALLREAIALDPGLWEAHYNLAVLYRRRGELHGAIKELEAARKIQPAAKEPLYALAEARSALGEPRTASDLLAEYLKLRPDADDVRIALTALLREQARYDEALEQVRLVLVRDPQRAAALLEVGRVYRARNELDVAELVFNRALQKNERSPAPHNELGLVALARGDTQLAFDHFDRAVKADRAFSPARLNRAAVLLRAGDYKAAETEYRQVLEQNTDHDEARVGLAVSLRGQGKHAQARDEYARVLEHSPNHAAALYDLALLLVEFLDKQTEAAPLFERFLAVAGEGPARQSAERYIKELASQSKPAPPGK